MSCLHVHFLPSLVEPDALRGSTVVVIDVLRATTTIAAAIAAGAREVIPCGEVEEARATAARFAPGEVLLGGERGGLKIPGFDLGNSPSEYSPERVGGKRVVFTTTNGTQALLRCRQAARVLTAAFVNLSAVARAVQDVAQAVEDEARIDVICAGTRGAITREDVACAGCLVAVISRFARNADEPAPDRNDSAVVALHDWYYTPGGREKSALPIEATGLLDSQGARDLSEIGMAGDIFDSFKVDRWSCVPELDIARWSIRDSA